MNFKIIVSAVEGFMLGIYAIFKRKKHDKSIARKVPDAPKHRLNRIRDDYRKQLDERMLQSKKTTGNEP